MRCGRCKDDHATKEEVAECYNSPVPTNLPKRSRPPEELTRNPIITPRQRSYVEGLLAELGREESTLPKTLDEYGKHEISAVIEDLKKQVNAKRTEENRLAQIAARNAVVSEAPVRFDTRTTIDGTYPEDGTYTVVLDGNEGDYVTLRFHTSRTGFYSGKPCVQYLSGPDNDLSFTTFARPANGGVAIFSRYANTERVLRALSFILGASKEDLASAGETYAMRSGRCCRCGLKLTVPASLLRGMGPICAGKEAS